MKTTGDIAALKFEEFVKYAKGDSYLVYLALAHSISNTDEDIKKYIDYHLNKAYPEY